MTRFPRWRGAWSIRWRSDTNAGSRTPSGKPEVMLPTYSALNSSGSFLRARGLKMGARRRTEFPGRFAQVFGAHRRTASAMGSPTQAMWMTTMTGSMENGRFGIADKGRTTRFMRKYTATP
jgi:hypothetical protein